MSRPPRTVIEYRNYELPADFPIQMLSGENWRISDVPSGVLHFHNCLEIGLCESDGGFLGFRGEQRAFRAGDVTIISGDVPHTTWSDPGTASKWSYLHLDPFELVRPLFPAEALPKRRAAAAGRAGALLHPFAAGISGGAVAGPVHAGRDAAAPDGLCDQRAGAVRGAGR